MKVAAGLLSCAAMLSGVAWAQEAPMPPDGLVAFLESVRTGPMRVPQGFGVDLPAVSTSGGGRRVEPSLDVVAGRVSADQCVYQMRIELRWSGSAVKQGAEDTGGRSVLQRAPCETLTREVLAIASYEHSALVRRLQDGGRLASNQEREQIVQAVRNQPPLQIDVPPLLAARTIDSRVNLRVAPSLRAPVLAKVAARSDVRLLPTASQDWFQLDGQPGYLHASAITGLKRLAPAVQKAPRPPAADVVAVVGSAYLPLRSAPAYSGFVVGRLKPGTSLELEAINTPGWFKLRDGSGYVPEAGLEQLSRPGRLAGSQQTEVATAS